MQRPQEALTAACRRRDPAYPRQRPRPGHRPAVAAGRDHRRRDRQRAVERTAGLPGPVRRRGGAPDSGGPGYEGVQSLDWPGRRLLAAGRARPGRAGLVPARVRLPALPGPAGASAARVLRRACACPGCPASATTRRSPRVSAPRRPALAARSSASKAAGLPATSTMTGRSSCSPPGPRRSWPGRPAPITPDAFRGRSARRDFVDAHLRAGSRPFGPRVQRAQPAGRHRVLRLRHVRGRAVHRAWTPTAWPAGGRLPGPGSGPLAGGPAARVHSAYRGPDGSDGQDRPRDRLVVVFSHHGTDTLDNSRGGHHGPDGEPLLGAGLRGLLHRFPNVVLWLNGHTHTNACPPAPRPCRTRLAGSGRSPPARWWTGPARPGSSSSSITASTCRRDHHGRPRQPRRAGAAWRPRTSSPRCIASSRPTCPGTSRPWPAAPATGTWSCGSPAVPAQAPARRCSPQPLQVGGGQAMIGQPLPGPAIPLVHLAQERGHGLGPHPVLVTRVWRRCPGSTAGTAAAAR